MASRVTYYRTFSYTDVKLGWEIQTNLSAFFDKKEREKFNAIALCRIRFLSSLKKNYLYKNIPVLCQELNVG